MASLHPCQRPRSFPAYSCAEGQAIRGPLFEHDLCGKPVPTFPGHASEGGNYERNGLQLPLGRRQNGIGFGTALAIAISYTTNHSILWAIIHGFFSWLYVIYFALFK
jgi:hypothetical protein